MLRPEVDDLHAQRIDTVHATMELVEKLKMSPTRVQLDALVQLSGTVNGLIKAAATLAARDPALSEAEDFICADASAAFRQFFRLERDAPAALSPGPLNWE